MIMKEAPRLVAVREFGFVALLDTVRAAIEFECLVLEVDGQQAIVATPGTSLITEEGEWVEASVELVRARAAYVDVVLEVAEWSMPFVLQASGRCGNLACKQTGIHPGVSAAGPAGGSEGSRSLLRAGAGADGVGDGCGCQPSSGKPAVEGGSSCGPGDPGPSLGRSGPPTVGGDFLRDRPGRRERLRGSRQRQLGAGGQSSDSAVAGVDGSSRAAAGRRERSPSHRWRSPDPSGGNRPKRGRQRWRTNTGRRPQRLQTQLLFLEMWTQLREK